MKQQPVLLSQHTHHPTEGMRNVRYWKQLLCLMLLIHPDEAEEFFVREKLTADDIQHARNVVASDDPAVRTDKLTGLGSWESSNKKDPATGKWVKRKDGTGTAGAKPAGKRKLSPPGHAVSRKKRLREMFEDDSDQSVSSDSDDSDTSSSTFDGKKPHGGAWGGSWAADWGGAWGGGWNADGSWDDGAWSAESGESNPKLIMKDKSNSFSITISLNYISEGL
jgi:hypothetical protein